MTREEFDKLYLGKAVHCDTEEKANHFLALADSVGYEWNSGISLMEEFNCWETYKEETCYEITKYGLLLADTKCFKLDGYQIIEYQLQSKFKVGDKVRVKNTLFTTINGKLGVIERAFSSSPSPYGVKIDGTLWYFYENELEKVEEPTYEEEPIDDIIEEIEYHQIAINVLLNRLRRKVKAK